jgi:hypothetical protein
VRRLLMSVKWEWMGSILITDAKLRGVGLVDSPD